jgi:serine phosphatase RsbU (regulator of sigma subunit)
MTNDYQDGPPFEPDKIAWLRLESGPQECRPIRLDSEKCAIGRSRDNDVVLIAPNVSRYHAEIKFTDGDTWIIKNLGARNPTQVNEREEESISLRDGDRVTIGEYEFRFIISDTPDVAKFSGSSTASGSRLPPGSIRKSARRDPAIAEGRLSAFYEIASELGALNQRSQVLPFLSDLLLKRMPASHCAILAPATSDIGAIHISGAKTAGPRMFSSTVIGEVRRSAECILVPRVTQDPLFMDAESLITSGVASIVCAPLMLGDTTEAIVYIDRTGGFEPFGGDDLDFVTAVTRLASLSLENCRLLELDRERRRTRERIQLAREIQVRMFPHQLPQHINLEFAAVNIPSEQISGDWYDALEVEPGRYMAALADVAGKGVDAALVTANLQSAFRILGSMKADPAECLRWLNDLLCENLPPDRFATMIVATIDANSGRAILASAGHNHPIHIGESEPRYFDPDAGFPLGIVEDTVYEVFAFDLEPGQTLLFYSDGIVDTARRDGEMFGEDRLLAIATSHTSRTTAQLVAQITEGVVDFKGDFPQVDDLTLLAVKRLS